MSKHTHAIFRLLTGAGLALAVSATPVVAQPDNPGESAMTGRPAEGNALGGPRVKDRQVPGVNEGFGAAGKEVGGKGAGDRLPPRVFREALQVILQEDAPEAIRASDDQRDKIKTIQQDFESQMKSYVESHRAELEELRGKIPGGGPAGEILKRFDKGKGADKRPPHGGLGEKGKGPADIPPEARAQMKELMEGMPSFEQAYTRVWDTLNPAQREAVEAKLHVFKDEMSKRRQEDYVRQRVGQGKRPGPDGAPSPFGARRPNGPEGSGPGPFGNRRPQAPEGGPSPFGPQRPAGAQGAGPGPFSERGPGPGQQGLADRRDRLMRIFERMSPERQEQILQRLEQMQPGDGGPGPDGGRRGRGGPGRGQPKPAPDMQDLRIPPPGEAMDNQAPPPPRSGEQP